MRIKTISGIRIKESSLVEVVLQEATILETSRVTRTIPVVIQEAILEETQEDILKTRNTHHVTCLLNVSHKTLTKLQMLNRNCRKKSQRGYQHLIWTVQLA